MLPFWGFVAVTAPLVLSPGPSTAVVLRNSIAGGAPAGLITAAGANAGSFCYGLLTALGFGAALQRWPSAWLVLRWAGVAYLACLGIQSLLNMRRARNVVGPAQAGPYVAGRRERLQPAVPPSRDGWRSFASGYATNVLNPSLAAFYLIVVPQFVPRGSPFISGILTLTLIHITMALAWHSSWALGGATLARVLSRRRPRQFLDLITGLVLLILAVKVFASVTP